MVDMTRRSYGQYCGLAKALDHVGDRWTLLIVRELLVEPRRYSTLRAALPGIATNLLGDRLSDLVSDGLVAKAGDGLYELTEAGRGLEETVHSLVRWGGRWMHQRDESELFRPQWLIVALRALLPPDRSGSVEVRVEGEVLHVMPGSIGEGSPAAPDATVEGSAQGVLGVAAGVLPVSSLKVTGNKDIAKAVLQPLQVAEQT